MMDSAFRETTGDCTGIIQTILPLQLSSWYGNSLVAVRGISNMVMGKTKRVSFPGYKA
jgi:hypothetical protein